MQDYLIDRAKELGRYILETKSTIRQTAKFFDLSKSTVHIDVSKRLKKVDPELYFGVDKILENNFKEKHIRGGLATKNKYLKNVFNKKTQKND